MVKASSCVDKNGVKKGAWSEEEDNKLKIYIQRYGHWNWGLLPKFAGVSRSGKSCRLRWMNYLRPNMKHGNFTKEEDDLVIDLHNKLGNKWSAIAAKLPGRSDNEIKNRWNTHLKKRALISDHHTVAENEHIGTLESDQDQANVNENPVKETDVELDQQEVESLFAGILSDESPSSSSRTESSSYPDYASLSDLSPQTFEDELVGNFWTQPFLPYNDSIGPSCDDNFLPPFNFVNDFISQPPSCENMMMTDEFLWSTLDTFVDRHNMDFIN